MTMLAAVRPVNPTPLATAAFFNVFFTNFGVCSETAWPTFCAVPSTLLPPFSAASPAAALTALPPASRTVASPVSAATVLAAPFSAVSVAAACPVFPAVSFAASLTTVSPASAAAFLPQPGFAVYAATKAYVLSYSRALGKELAGRGIKVTAVCPGPVDTEFFTLAEEHASAPVYKKLFMSKTEDVAARALADSRAGKTVSVYGGPMKLFRLLAKLVPTDLLLKFF